MKKIFATAILLSAMLLMAEPVCIGEVCYPSREAAIAAGALPPDGADAGKGAVDAAMGKGEPSMKARVAFGYMRPPQFIAFLRGEADSSPFADRSALVVVLLVLLGGMLANLTPCVLPLVPVNVAILLGRGESSRTSRLARGFAYGAGMAAAYGALGLAAAFGGMAFGSVQSSAWFNLGVALVFIVLGLGMLDVVNIDFAAMWRRVVSKGRAAPASRPASRGLGGAFLLGAGAAVLAGACVQPILIAMLVYTADGFAAGRWWTVSLPFVLGAGMGLPWIFVAGGLSVLPRPGAWMVWVKRGFAVVIFAMAAWYGYLAWTIWSTSAREPRGQTLSSRGQTLSSEPRGQTLSAEPRGQTLSSRGQTLEATPQTWGQTLKSAKAEGRPILVDIWATWCKNCLAMEKTTFKDVGALDELSRFTVIRLQAEDMADLAKIPELGGLEIKGIPAFVIFER